MNEYLETLVGAEGDRFAGKVLREQVFMTGKAKVDEPSPIADRSGGEWGDKGLVLGDVVHVPDHIVAGQDAGDGQVEGGQSGGEGSLGHGREFVLWAERATADRRRHGDVRRLSGGCDGKEKAGGGQHECKNQGDGDPQ